MLTRFGVSEASAEKIPVESSDPTTRESSVSRRPDNFVSSSPIKRDTNGKDSGKAVLALAALVSLLAFGGAVYKIQQIQ